MCAPPSPSSTTPGEISYRTLSGRQCDLGIRIGGARRACWPDTACPKTRTGTVGGAAAFPAAAGGRGICSGAATWGDVSSITPRANPIPAFQWPCWRFNLISCEAAPFVAPAMGRLYRQELQVQAQFLQSPSLTSSSTNLLLSRQVPRTNRLSSDRAHSGDPSGRHCSRSAMRRTRRAGGWVGFRV